MQELVVQKGRTVVVPVSLGYDVSGDTITSKIRKGRHSESDLIASWTVTFTTDGTDGELTLTLDDSVTATIEETSGFMDMKRLTGGEPVSVFDEPLPVKIVDVVTD